MTHPQATPFDAMRPIANAVLYEGYLLYPYTASAAKNKMRWQFGVVVPKAYEAEGTGEHGEQHTELLMDATDRTRVDVLVRFLHVQARTVEVPLGDGFVEVPSLDVDGTPYLTFDETVECEVPLRLDLSEGDAVSVPVRFAAHRIEEALLDARGELAGRIVRTRWPLAGTLGAAAEHVDGMPDVRVLRVRLENHSGVVTSAERGGMLRTAFISAHTMFSIENGAFLSPIDPPDYAQALSETLQSRHTWPVLMGDAGLDAQRSPLVLSSPIVLGDFPEVGKKTDGDAFDSTEIDELLTLSVLSLSDAERAEARVTDPRARAIVDRAERFGADDIARLHDGELLRIGDGVLARLNETDFSAIYDGEGSPFNDAALAMETRFTDPRSRTLVDLSDPAQAEAAFNAGDLARLRSGDLDPFEALPPKSVLVGGVLIEKGSSVKLSPKRRADAWDQFLTGKIATVKAIHQDVEDKIYVAVTIDADPATDMHDWYGRSFFFEPDEVEAVPAAAS